MKGVIMAKKIKKEVEEAAIENVPNIENFNIRKLFKFEGAHQLFKAYSDCCSSTIHGHSYVVEIFFRDNRLDDTGMVIDFGEISDCFRKYINEEWDHCLIMPSTFSDEYLNLLGKYNKHLRIVTYNPTAENMAKDMYGVLKHMLEQKVGTVQSRMLWMVRVHETVTGYAEYSEQVV
jgi:6-pyruvoyltetrahydropterin/6-carboxytetrahydropterin synthase